MYIFIDWNFENINRIVVIFIIITNLFDCPMHADLVFLFCRHNIKYISMFSMSNINAIFSSIMLQFSFYSAVCHDIQNYMIFFSPTTWLLSWMSRSKAAILKRRLTTGQILWYLDISHVYSWLAYFEKKTLTSLQRRSRNFSQHILHIMKCQISEIIK